MKAQLTKVDNQGRIVLPEIVQKLSGILPETDVIIEMKEEGVFIRSKKSSTPISDRIATMNLPVSDWKSMEEKIIEGHLK